MWGEGISAANQDAYIWRATAAVAERLWSPYDQTSDTGSASNRLVEQLCRLEQQGVRAGPIQPSYCPIDPYIPPLHAAGQRVIDALAEQTDSERVSLSLSAEDARLVQQLLERALKQTIL
jgi:hypothetical protein